MHSISTYFSKRYSSQNHVIRFWHGRRTYVCLEGKLRDAHTRACRFGIWDDLNDWGLGGQRVRLSDWSQASQTRPRTGFIHGGIVGHIGQIDVALR